MYNSPVSANIPDSALNSPPSIVSNNEQISNSIRRNEAVSAPVRTNRNKPSTQNQHVHQHQIANPTHRSFDSGFSTTQPIVGYSIQSSLHGISVLEKSKIAQNITHNLPVAPQNQISQTSSSQVLSNSPGYNNISNNSPAHSQNHRSDSLDNLLNSHHSASSSIPAHVFTNSGSETEAERDLAEELQATCLELEDAHELISGLNIEKADFIIALAELKTKVNEHSDTNKNLTDKIKRDAERIHHIRQSSQEQLLDEHSKKYSAFKNILYKCGKKFLTEVDGCHRMAYENCPHPKLTSDIKNLNVL